MIYLESTWLTLSFLTQRKTETTCRHFELATAPFLRAQSKASYDRTTHQMNRDTLLESP
jgi:hypothetical protein